MPHKPWKDDVPLLLRTIEQCLVDKELEFLALSEQAVQQKSIGPDEAKQLNALAKEIRPQHRKLFTDFKAKHPQLPGIELLQ